MELTLLLALTLGQKASDDVDPEPVSKKGVFARLVAKQTKFKLDRQGMTAAEYKKAAQNGTATAIGVDMDFVITNATKNTVRVRVTGAAPRLTLKLQGDGAVVGPQENTKGGKAGTGYKVLAPGEKVSIPITTLSGNQAGKGFARGKQNLYWTEPGTYKLSASLATTLDPDWNGKGGKGKVIGVTLDAPAITLEVEK